MYPFILPAPSSNATPYPRTGVALTDQPLTSPKSAAAIQWHSQPQPSPSLGAQPPSISALHHTDQSASDIASRSFVEFHTARDDVDGFNLATTSALSPEISTIRPEDRGQVGERSVNSHRSILSVSEQAASMPMTLPWPFHPHLLHYAGSSSGDSVRVMSCRKCRAEHYNTAVYSCIERGCNYHICLACALEQLAALNEVKRTERDKVEREPTIVAGQQQVKQTRKGRKSSKEDEVNGGKADHLMQRWDRAEVGEGELVHKDGDVTTLDVSVVPPVSYTQDRMKREYRSTKQWIRSIEREARDLGLPLSFACSLHADHTLSFHAVSPLSPVKLVHPNNTPPDGASLSYPANNHSAASSTDRYFCDAILSPYCMSHDLNKNLRPVYACPHCGYRLCLPCHRWYLLDLFSRMRATMSYERADEKIRQRMPEYYRSRKEDSRAIEYAHVMNRREVVWERKRRYALYVTAVSVLLLVVLFNAIITLQDSSVSYQLLNVTLLLVGCICAGLLSSALVSRLFTAHRLCMSHTRSVDSSYLDPSLAYFFDTSRIQSIPISALTPKQRDRLSDLYRHHTFVHYQQRTVIWSSLLADFLLWCAIGLLVAAVVLLYVDVVCDLEVYNVVDNCAIRAGVPVGALLFLVLLYPLWFSAMLRTSSWVERKKTERRLYAKEERQRTKWQRRE